MHPIFAEIQWMTGALLAALSVGGLLIGFLLLYVRFSRIEVLLSRLQEIQSLTEEIRELKKTMSELSLTKLEDHMEGLRRFSQNMDSTLESIAHGIMELNRQFGHTRAGKIQDLVERKFFNQGYDSVVILTDLTGELEEPFKLQIEGVRSGIMFKGTVVIQNGSVVETDLKPSYEAFP